MRQKYLSMSALGFLLSALFLSNVSGVGAAGGFAGSVVINEVGWAGSVDSTNDEWIELYNTTGQPVDLTGWTINDDQGSSIYALHGQIAANGYYLIEDNENVVNPNVADAIINVSLANTGDSLVLFDGNGQMIDAVNSSGGAWFAGSSTTKASMERKDALVSGDLASNWATSTGSGTTSSAGSPIIGTPGVLNSQTSQQAQAQTVSMSLSSGSVQVGQTLTVQVQVNNVTDLFSYGMDVVYDPAVLSFSSVNQGTFLSDTSVVATSFQAGLENGVAGKLVVAEARTMSTKTGRSGSGNLFTLSFDVVGTSALPSTLSFGPGSFLADPSSDISAQLNGAQFTSSSAQADPVTGLQVVEDAQRYALNLTWTSPASGATSYKVYRQNSHGVWILLGQTNQPNFTDNDSLQGGGKIIPLLDYSYKVVAVNGGTDSSAVQGSGKETRGLKGDNNRSDRVDGRDLELLARHFTQTDADPAFDALVDTTYDGQIDGSDLIDLGASFAKVYP